MKQMIKMFLRLIDRLKFSCTWFLWINTFKRFSIECRLVTAWLSDSRWSFAELFCDSQNACLSRTSLLLWRQKLNKIDVGGRDIVLSRTQLKSVLILTILIFNFYFSIILWSFFKFCILFWLQIQSFIFYFSDQLL